MLRHGNEFERKCAASALRGFRTPSAEAALLAALNDPDTGVRGNAFSALVEVRGLEAYHASYRDRIGVTYPLLGSELASVRALAVGEVRQLLARLDAGETPAALGLTPPVDDTKEPLATFMQSLQAQTAPWEHELATDGLDRLGVHEQRWIEDVLLSYLPVDPRAARALGRRISPRVVPPLHEVATSCGGLVQVEAAAALWRAHRDRDAHAVL